MMPDMFNRSVPVYPLNTSLSFVLSATTISSSPSKSRNVSLPPSTNFATAADDKVVAKVAFKVVIAAFTIKRVVTCIAIQKVVFKTVANIVVNNPAMQVSLLRSLRMPSLP